MYCIHAFVSATLLLACPVTVQAADTGRVIHTAADLRLALYDEARLGNMFDITAQIVSTQSLTHSFVVKDTTGTALVFLSDLRQGELVHAGDLARLKGVFQMRAGGCTPDLTTYEKISAGVPPFPRRVSPADLHTGKWDFDFVETEGTVKDVARDDIDRIWSFMVLNDGGTDIYVSVATPRNSLDSDLIGARVRVYGVVNATPQAKNRFGRPILCLRGKNQISILKRARDNIAEAPPLEATDASFLEQPRSIRRRVRGNVLAAWPGAILLQTASNAIVRIETDEAVGPRAGESVESAGFVVSDQPTPLLVQSRWRSLDDGPVRSLPDATPLSIHALIEPHGSRNVFNIKSYGQRVRIRGKVCNIPEQNAVSFHILSEGTLIPIRCGNGTARPSNAQLGSLVEVAGTFVLEASRRHPRVSLPHIEAAFLVTNTADDLRILKAPSWWTVPRLLYLVASLVISLVAILLWNLLLHRASERKSRELFRVEIAKAEADLRVDERTRLAAELHDYFSQNLTAIAYQVSAAERARTAFPDESAKHLATADRMLVSCRAELRRCLWDLRSNTLDSDDFNAAIRTVLESVIDDTTLVVRFNVPRADMRESTAHAILSIIRELSGNAVQHGKAKTIRIAGERLPNALRFSVRDDGCGFVPDVAPSTETGHFGLQGVRDRVQRHGGLFTIDSAPGRGTRAVVTLFTETSV